MKVKGIEPGSPDLSGKHLYPLSYLTGPYFLLLFQDRGAAQASGCGWLCLSDLPSAFCVLAAFLSLPGQTPLKRTLLHGREVTSQAAPEAERICSQHS